LQWSLDIFTYVMCITHRSYIENYMHR
jgi:hypothetical protein